MVELYPEFQPTSDSAREALQAELIDLAGRNPLTRRVAEILIRDEPLPTDIRHNSKIFREQLAASLD